MRIIALASFSGVRTVAARVASLLAISVGSASVVLAQCPTTASTATNAASTTLTLCMQIKPVLRLTITSPTTALNSPTRVNYGSLAANAYLTTATPVAAASGPTISVVANLGYQVTIAAATTNFPTAPSGVSKPLSDVQWKTAATSFTALSTGGGTMLSGGATTSLLSPASATLSFQSRWAFERDKPGAYSGSVTITLAGN